jgi:hypothetical protein
MPGPLKIVQKNFNIADIEAIANAAQEQILMVDQKDRDLNKLIIKRNNYGKFIPQFIGKFRTFHRQFLANLGKTDVIIIYQSKIIFCKIDSKGNIKQVIQINGNGYVKNPRVFHFTNFGLVINFIKDIKPQQNKLPEDYIELIFQNSVDLIRKSEQNSKTFLSIQPMIKNYTGLVLEQIFIQTGKNITVDELLKNIQRSIEL